MFFLNMYKSDPTAYCGYNAGLRYPGPGFSMRMAQATR